MQTEFRKFDGDINSHVAKNPQFLNNNLLDKLVKIETISVLPVKERMVIRTHLADLIDLPNEFREHYSSNGLNHALMSHCIWRVITLIQRALTIQEKGIKKGTLVEMWQGQYRVNSISIEYKLGLKGINSSYCPKQVKVVIEV